ncbi:MAG: hypothetical protein CME62_03615 [Halobacteriovoraceae bacterium]|nr:hypothetical protein [Halobacteriovoraceae bacterium]|tara:strand:- start:9146 stop:10474 length:1329 start_codon:yes stop_codon:yes gene_type:complete
MNEAQLCQYSQTEMIKRVYQELPKGSLISIISALFFSYFYYQETQSRLIWIWITFISLAGAYQIFSSRTFLKSLNKYPEYFWKKTLSVGAVLTSLAWSFQSFMMLGVENLTLNGIYMAQLIGISVGGAIATLAIKKISYVYILLMISSLSLRTIIEQHDYFIWFVLLQFLFIIYCLKMIKTFSEAVLNAEMASLRAKNELHLQNQLQIEKLKSIQSARLASLGEMAAGISHEINNPLSLMRGRVDMLDDLYQNEKMSSKDLEEFLDSAKQSTERISNIIMSMKNLSRIKDKSEFQSFKLDTVLKEIKTLVSHRLELENIECELDLKDMTYHADRSEIAQVILNLVNNAIDAVCDDEENKWIKITESWDDENNYITITDSGHGIPEETLGRMFDPFYTSKEVGKGTGLGLSLSKSLMKRNNGDLNYNPNSKHTSFILTFPQTP